MGLSGNTCSFTSSSRPLRSYKHILFTKVVNNKFARGAPASLKRIVVVVLIKAINNSENCSH